MKLCKVRLELEDTHFNKIDVPMNKAWDAVIEKLDFPGLDREAAKRRWKNCIQDYRAWKKPPSTGAGNANQIHQKEPKDWVKVLDDHYSQKDTHNPPYLYDTAATQPERRSEKRPVCLDDVFFGGPTEAIPEKDVGAIEKDNFESIRKKKKKKTSAENEVDLGDFLKAQMGQNDRAVKASEDMAGAIRSLVGLFRPNQPPRRSTVRFHYDDSTDYDEDPAPRY